MMMMMILMILMILLGPLRAACAAPGTSRGSSRSNRAPLLTGHGFDAAGGW
jgi:hypothetical protein